MTTAVPETNLSAPTPAPPATPSPTDRSGQRRSAPAPETVRLYTADWTAFATWCDRAGELPLPAAAATIERYLQAHLETLGRGALDRRLAAIAYIHRNHGLGSPTKDPTLRRRLRPLKRSAKSAHRDPPPTAAALARMAAACPGDLAGLRDRALLLLASAGLGRGILVGLDAEHVAFRATELHLTISTDLPHRGGASGDVAIPRETRSGACPVRALEDWLRASDTRFGPVFRKIDRWGNVEHRRLGTDAIRRILHRRTLRRRRGPRAPAT